MRKVLHMSTKNALITQISKKLKNVSQIDVFSSPKFSPIYYAFHFKAVLILSKIKSFVCESGVKKKFVVRCCLRKSCEVQNQCQNLNKNKKIILVRGNHQIYPFSLRISLLFFWRFAPEDFLALRKP